MNEPSQNSDLRNDPELEARIVALVMGEVDDLERSQLQALLTARPELLAFKNEIECVHGLLDSVSGETWMDQENSWKLPSEKRGAVLDLIEADSRVDGESPIAFSLFNASDWTLNRVCWSLSKIAAVLCVAGFFGFVAYSNLSSPTEQEVASVSAPRGGTSLRYDFAPQKSAREKLGSVEGWSYKADAPASDLSFTDVQDGLSIQSVQPDGDRSKGIKDGLWGDTGGMGSGGIIANGERGWAEITESPIPSVELETRFDGDAIRVILPQTAQPNTMPGMAEEYGKLPSAHFYDEGITHFPVPNDTLSVQDRVDSIAANDFKSSSQGVSKQEMPSRGRFGEYFGNDKTSVLGDKDLTQNAPDEKQKYMRGSAVSNGPPASPAKPQGSESLGAASNQPTEGEALKYLNESVLEKNNVALSDGPVAEFEGRAPLLLGAIVDSQAGNRDGETMPSVSSSGEGNVKEVTTWELDLTQRGDAVLGKSNGRDTVGLERKERNARGLATSLGRSAALLESNAKEIPFSTFSLHVSDVSFKLAQAAFARGEWPDAERIRIEEFVNAFDYGDRLPSQSEKVACRVEQVIHPFLQQRNLLRVSMRTSAQGRSNTTPLRLTLLLDNSGSMERIDRQQTLRRAFSLLAQQLTEHDQVTLISFARQPRLLADRVSGADAQQLVQLVESLPSEGGTNLEAALQLAFEKAKEQQLEGAQNRIVLLTDGAVNLGDASPVSLSLMITQMRDAGIAFDAAGISAEGLNDEVLEALTRQGDGRYYLLDSLESADDGFAKQIAGALRPSAKNVKVQVEFNPNRVGSYKLLGFEQHRLKQEDFRNDAVDAAEMTAEEAGVAVYQFEAKPDGEGDVGSVSVRFLDLATGEMIENRWPIPYDADTPRPEQASPSVRLAISAALFAAKLRGDALGESVDLKTLTELVAGLPEQDRSSSRVQQLQQMLHQALQSE